MTAAAIAEGAESSRTARELYYSARDHHLAGRYEEAVAEAKQCLALKPGDRLCSELIPKAETARARDYRTQYAKVPAVDLRGRKALLEKVAASNPRDAWAAEELRRVSAERDAVLAAARSYVEVSITKCGALNTLPSEVQPYAPFLPELHVLQVEGMRRAAQEATRQATATGDYRQAAACLSSYSKDLTPEITALVQTAVVDLSARAKRAVESSDLRTISDVLESIEALSEWLPSESAATIRFSLAPEAARALVMAIPPGFPKAGAPSARVIQHVLLGGKETLLRLDEIPWESVAGGDPRERTVLMVRGNRSEDCPPAAAPEELRSAVAKALPRFLSAAEDGPVTIEVTEISCRFARESVETERVSSTYVATQQQVANPKYAQLQVELQVAMAELARAEAAAAANQNFGTGFARGLAQGRVGKLRRALAETPPYEMIPITAPYQAVRVRVTETASIGAKIAVRDSASRYSDVAWVHEAADASGDGLTGAMESDAQGLRNQEPRLPGREAGFAVASQKLDDALATATRRLLAEAFLARAAAAQQSGRSVEALGSALLAQDADKTTASRAGIDAQLRLAADTPLAKIAALTLPDLRQFSAAASRPGSGSSKPSGRAAIVDVALNAVVTIVTAGGGGTGFFITENGLLLTNAHVIENAGRVVVRTRSGESFLATPVKVAREVDLALLRIQVGRVPSLVMATTESAQVGMDVLAIGSPLGLTGTVTKGVLSAIRKFNGVAFLQIDAAINPGNSGGPLLTEDGRVIGVNTSKIAAESVEGMGFAVAVSEARRVFGEQLR